jgi:hypothetical protein
MKANSNMKTIRVSEEVWNAIRGNGKFGETEEDQVLRRIFKISSNNFQTRPNGLASPPPAKESNKQYGWKERRAMNRMRDETGKGNKLVLEFDHGPRFEMPFPAKDNQFAIRKLRNEAVKFVRSSGGTKGQEHAAIKALTSRGYFVAKPSDPSEFI